MPWKFYEPYTVKFQRLLQTIDRLYDQYGPISLVGVSASGSAGLHAFMERQQKIDKFVAITAWLSEKDSVFPSINLLTFNYPDYKEAILIAQQITSSLSREEKERMMSIHGKWDEIIPTPTSEIDGVTTLVTPTYEHTVNAIYPLFASQKEIADFLFPYERSPLANIKYSFT